MNEIVKWMDENVLMLNGEKTKVVVFGSKIKSDRFGNFGITVDGNQIVETTQIKCLG